MLLRNGDGELDAQVVEFGPEDIPRRFLQGQSLVGSEVEVQLPKYIQASVGLLTLNGIIPGSQQGSLAILLAVYQSLSEGLCSLAFRMRLDQRLDLGAGPGPVTVVEQLLNVGRNLVESLVVGRIAVMVRLRPQLLGEFLVLGLFGDLFYQSIGCIEILLLQLVKDGLPQRLLVGVAKNDRLGRLAPDRPLFQPATKAGARKRALRIA